MSNYYEIRAPNAVAWWRIHPNRIERSCDLYDSEGDELIPDDMNPDELVQLFATFVERIESTLNDPSGNCDIQMIERNMPSFIPYLLSIARASH